MNDVRLREKEREVLRRQLASWFGDERQAFLASDLAIIVEDIIATRVAEALTATADAWQWGEWANAPRCADRIQERIASAQYVTDWLRNRAALRAADAPLSDVERDGGRGGAGDE